MNKILNAITCKEPKRLVKPVLWNALANLSNLLPFLCLAYIVDQIYEYFIHWRSISANYRWGFSRAGMQVRWETP